MSLSNEGIHVPFIYKAKIKKQEEQEQEEMRKSTVTEERTENIKSPQGKRCKTLSHSISSSKGCHPSVVVNSLLPCKLPLNNYSIFNPLLHGM